MSYWKYIASWIWTSGPKKLFKSKWLSLPLSAHFSPVSDWRLLTSTLLPRLDPVKCGKRSFKFGIEEPHRIKNFAEGCRCSCPVSLSKGEDAIVSQISHDRRVGNSIVDQVA